MLPEALSPWYLSPQKQNSVIIIMTTTTSTITKASWISLVALFSYKIIDPTKYFTMPRNFRLNKHNFNISSEFGSSTVPRTHCPKYFGRLSFSSSRQVYALHPPCWECVLFLKASREKSSSKGWDNKAWPYAAFPVELISQVSDLHGVYLAPLLSRRTEPLSEIIVSPTHPSGFVFILFWFFFPTEKFLLLPEWSTALRH